MKFETKTAFYTANRIKTVQLRPSISLCSLATSHDVGNGEFLWHYNWSTTRRKYDRTSKGIRWAFFSSVSNNEWTRDERKKGIKEEEIFSVARIPGISAAFAPAYEFFKNTISGRVIAAAGRRTTACNVSA